MSNRPNHDDSIIAGIIVLGVIIFFFYLQIKNFAIWAALDFKTALRVLAWIVAAIATPIFLTRLFNLSIC